MMNNNFNFEVNDVVRVLVNGKHWVKGTVISIRGRHIAVSVPTYYGNTNGIIRKITIQENVENVRAVAETLKEMETLKEKGFRL